MPKYYWALYEEGANLYDNFQSLLDFLGVKTARDYKQDIADWLHLESIDDLAPFCIYRKNGRELVLVSIF